MDTITDGSIILQDAPQDDIQFKHLIGGSESFARNYNVIPFTADPQALIRFGFNIRINEDDIDSA